MKRLSSFGLLMVWLLTSPSATAIQKQQLPEILKPWADWALGDDSQVDCPFAFADFQQKRCSWPGSLKLNLHRQGGHFSGEWQLYRDDWLTLPGDQEHWPQQVNVNRLPAIVVEHDGKPAIRLPAGHYQINGNFIWSSMPENLALADDSGLIQLVIDDQDIAMPRIEQGALWLAPATNIDPQNQQNSLDLQVFRQIVDSIPLQVVTQLELDVSGAARQISLPLALLPQFTPTSLESPLPARLEADGRLSLQIRPGHWSLTLTARHTQPLEQLELHAPSDGSWPNSELWSFQAVPSLRLVEIEGLPAIDASQSNLPESWRHLPTYQIQDGQAMRFKSLRRGDAEPEPNQLTLNRQLWLDFDGQGYTVSDHISGKMSRDWRLNALPQTLLGQVLLNGQNQLITLDGDRDQGIEVRRGMLDLQADSRIQSEIGNLSAVGWQQSFQQARAELNIPPGWRLLAITGVDNDPASWLTQWTLLDLFLVLVTTLAISRLWDWRWGVVALLSLLLIWHEAEAPRWIWLNTLAAMALLRVVPVNRFSQWLYWYRNLCWLAMLVIVIPFMIDQCRIGLYPQLESVGQNLADPAEVVSQQLNEVASAMPEAIDSLPGVADSKALPSKAKVLSLAASPASLVADFERVDPNANLQTGPGLPKWQWQRIELSWNGAVDQQQRIALWYLSPAWMMALHFLHALLTGLLALRLLDAVDANWRPRLPKLAMLLFVPALLFPVEDLRADIPDPAMLEQLRTRLSLPPACLPQCAQLASLNLNAGRDSLQLALELHAQQSLYLPLPIQLAQWYPSLVEVDAHPAQGLTRQADGSLWLMLPAGVHHVSVKGRYPTRGQFSLPLPMSPQFTRIQLSEGWRIDGVYENGKTGPQLEFHRIEEAVKNTAQVSLPAFVEVERTLQLGLDWKVVTRVNNLGDSQSSVMLELPLLPGEAVMSNDIRVKDGKVLVNMAAGQSQLEWQSTLEKRDLLQLEADASGRWSEVWHADISPIWHMQASGIPIIRHQNQQGSWLPEWRPWPGESVQLRISRPRASAGATLTIDKSLIQVYPGKRSEKAELSLDLRSSKGGQHSLTLPEGAVLQSATIDGVTLPIRQQANRVTLPIHPGLQQIHLSWQTPEAQEFVFTSPQLDLGVASVNSHIQAFVGDDRWVLLTFGPRLGPAALIWGLLLVLLISSFGLHRLPTPLKHWQWFLLLIGLSQLQIFAALLVVAWLLALSLRERRASNQIVWFNLNQVGLALLTLCSIGLLFAAVQQGLLGGPDMQIAGNHSSANQLNWYQDRSDAQLPTALIISAPMMLYRLAMLGWALWMALSLLDWLRWGWNCFASGGIWRNTSSIAKS